MEDESEGSPHRDIDYRDCAEDDCRKPCSARRVGKRIVCNAKGSNIAHHWHRVEGSWRMSADPADLGVLPLCWVLARSGDP
ncbi:hypothetical protein PGB90_010596 [Kerria lacca]